VAPPGLKPDVSFRHAALKRRSSTAPPRSRHAADDLPE
jgi:hypothetical protein